MNPDPTSLDLFHGPLVPPPAPWWPLTPGWIIILGAAGLLLLGIILKSIISWQANRYRREALSILNQSSTTAPMIAALMKRATLTVWPRKDVAGLTGPPWLAFLDQSEGGNSFSKAPANLIETIAFQPPTRTDPASLKVPARQWLQKHQRKDEP